MRPHDTDYDDFDDIDDFGVPGIRAIRHMMNESQREELSLQGRSHPGPAGKDRWRDYDADEFDRFSGLTIDNH